MKYKKTTLPSGLRVITVPLLGNPSVTTMVLVEAGSNYETKTQGGLSHFLEHMVFKGTKNRPNFLDIALELEVIGATSNAATGNEFTEYYAKAEKRHFSKLMDVVSDIYLNPTFPKETLEKERGVILQEISMYEDLPQRKVWDVLYALVYGDVPAGRSVIGTRENIKRFKRTDIMKYRDAHYVADKTMVVVAGDVEHKEVLKEVRKHFKNIPQSKSLTKPKVRDIQKKPEVSIHRKKTDQTHLVIALRAFGAGDKRASALKLMSYIMGKGFSSRLFQKMREEMGACYYVSSDVDTYTDHGLYTISAGVDALRLEEVVRALLAVCQKFKEELVPQEELEKAKEYLIGRLYMSLETSDSLADFYAEQEVLSRVLKTPRELEKEIRAVTAKDIQKVAKDIFKNEKLNLAVVGDIKNASKLEKILHF